MKWTIDLAHSRVEFAVRRSRGALQAGQFERVGGVIDFTDDGAPQHLEAVIEVRGSHATATGETSADPSEGFMDTENGPQMTFLSAPLEPLESNRYIAPGTLELKGDLHPIMLEVIVDDRVRDRSGGERVHISASGRLQLDDWVRTWMGIPDLSTRTDGEEVRLTFHLEAVTPEALREDYDLILSMLAHAA